MASLVTSCHRSLVLLAVLSFPGAASAQTLDDIRQQFRDSIGREAFADLITGFVMVGEEPDISAATLRIDGDGGASGDAKLSTLKLPWSTNIEIEGAPGTLFLEASLGYLEAQQEVRVTLPPPLPSESRIDTRWKAFGGLVGGGWKFPLGSGFALRPTVDFGYARVESKARYDAVGQALLQPILDGIAYNWDSDSLITSGSLALLFERPLGGQNRLDLSSRYTYAHIDTFRATDSVQEGNQDSQLLTSRLDLTGPTGLEPWDAPLYWNVFATHAWFMDLPKEVLGFSQLFELGVAVELRLADLSLPVNNLRLGGSLIKGDGVTGYTVGFSVKF